MSEFERIAEDAARSRHAVLLVGAMDTGKTTMARAILEAAVRIGRPAALLDADLGQKTVGPPATVTLRGIREPADLEPERLAVQDDLWFVGSTSPQGHLLPLVAGVAALRRRAESRGAQLLVVDTSGLVSGIYGQILKYHKVEALLPDMVIGMQRGEELLPLLGVVQRFFETQVVPLGVPHGVVDTSVERRAENREAAMRRYFSGELHRFRVKPTVFLPTLPPMFDLAQLDRLLVGLADGRGGWLGIGYLEHVAGEGVLRLITPVAEGPRGLRLGAVRLDGSYQPRRVDLRNLFGSE